MSNLILVIGHTGQGKSTFVKNFIKNRNCLVFDVNNEYPDLESDLKKPRAKFVGLPSEFIEQCFKRRNTNLVFEEATGFLRGAVNMKLQKLIIEKRHKNNNLLFIFHSINRVPPVIYEISNYIILFKTNDQETTILNKYPMLLKPFRELKKAPKYTHKTIKTIDQ